MLRKHAKIRCDVQHFSPFHLLYRAGSEPEQVKKAITEILKPYLSDQQFLEEYAINLLIPESMNVLSLQQNAWLMDRFHWCLSVHSEAKKADAKQCLAACLFWKPKVDSSAVKFWSMFNLQENKDRLEIEEYVCVCMRELGETIEAFIRPYLKVLLHHAGIRDGVRVEPAGIDRMDLGKIVDDLIHKTDYPDLFAPPPWNVRLNQWRNIAYHHSARTDKGIIICEYGSSHCKKEVRLSREDLLEALKTCADIFKAVSTAFRLFCLDNAEALPENEHESTPFLREEAGFMNMSAALASQGFRVADYISNEDEARLVVQDFSELDPLRRRIHASQFVYPLWVLTKAKRLTVEYRMSDGTPCLLSTADSAVCQQIFDGEIEFHDLANSVCLVDLREHH